MRQEGGRLLVVVVVVYIVSRNLLGKLLKGERGESGSITWCRKGNVESK